MQIPAQPQSLPPELQQLEQQIQLQAKIIAQSIDGTARLETPKGEIVVKTDVQLPVGRAITVVLPAIEAAVKDILLNLPRALLPPQSTPVPATPLQQPPPVLLPATALQNLPPLLPGETLAAVPLPKPAAIFETAEKPQLPLPASATKADSNLPQPLSQTTLPAGKVLQTPSLTNNPKIQDFLELARQIGPALRTATPQQSPTAANAAGKTPSLLETLVTLQNQTAAARPAAPPVPLPGKAVSISSQQPVFFKIGRVLPPQQQSTGTPAPQQPATQTPKIATTTPSTPTLTATVTGTTLQGQPIVQISGKGAFVLQTSTPLPVDTQITLQSASAPAQAPKLAAPVHVIQTPEGDIILPAFDPLSSQDWPALEETLQSLAHAAPQAAAALRASLPSPSQQLPATALFFLAALKSGVLENWVGEPTLSVLKQTGRQSLADLLRGDFSRIGRQSGETISGDWRVFSLPLNHDNQLSQIQILVRHFHQETTDREAAGKTEAGGRKLTRFVLNFGLSHLGAMQLDGLLQPKTLDLIVRTDKTLTPDMRQEIRKRFAEGLEHVNLTGELSFQTGKKGWIAAGEPAAGPEIIA